MGSFPIPQTHPDYGLYPLYAKLAERLPPEYQRKPWNVRYNSTNYEIIVGMKTASGEHIEIQEWEIFFPSDALIGQMLLVL